jgi:hypothetical protein
LMGQRVREEWRRCRKDVSEVILALSCLIHKDKKRRVFYICVCVFWIIMIPWQNHGLPALLQQEGSHAYLIRRQQPSVVLSWHHHPHAPQHHCFPPPLQPYCCCLAGNKYSSDKGYILIKILHY